MKLLDSRYEEIKDIASKLMAYCEIGSFKINSFEIALKLGFVVIPYSSYTIKEQELLLKYSEDGFGVIRNDDKCFIYYNDQKTFMRINNTIMHEIGHIVLDHSEESELAESETKFFAKYILAPPVLIHIIKPSSPDDIHKNFNISVEASIYAFRYYQNWVSYGKPNYTKYEKLILNTYYKHNDGEVIEF